MNGPPEASISTTTVRLSDRGLSPWLASILVGDQISGEN
jgi:hypothetical protein